MTKLPRGYYAITSDFENTENEFTFKGVTYEVEKGVNLFADYSDFFALEEVEIPDTVIEGLESDGFSCPVMLLSAGTHKIGKSRTIRGDIKRSVAIFGQKAGISPNLPASDPLSAPVLNPERANPEEETILDGNTYFGAMTIASPDVDVFIIDGVTCAKSLRFADQRGAAMETSCKLEYRNLIHKSPSGKHIYAFGTVGEGLPYDKEVVIENVRFEKDFFDLGYGGMGFILANPKTTLKNVCVDGTTQVFGFTTITRNQATGCATKEQSEINISDCYFARFKGENGLATSLKGANLRLNIENTTFVDASRENESPLQIHLPDDKSELIVKGCRIVDTRENAASVIEIRGEGSSITLENNEISGFATLTSYAPAAPTEAPDYIENREESWSTETEDAHTVIGTAAADFSTLDAYYEGCKAYYGDLHVHSNSGGTSDGRTLLADWVPEMDKVGLDFAIIVDHKQMRGYFLPEWDEERMIMGTEPGGGITDPLGANCVVAGFHYNMIFPHKYGLAMVLANFPEFEFHGDELTGSFKYPKFTRERLFQLNDYLRSIGGMLVHAHPRLVMGSDEPLDYYFGEHSYLEVIVGGTASHASFKSYDTWCEILAKGKHMFASAGSDTHRAVSMNCPSTFYTKRRFHTDFVDRMYAGNYAVGGVGVKMMIDGHPMGSEIEYKDGMTLTIRIDDFFHNTLKENTVYELEIITDKGVAYSSRFNGKEPQAIALEVQKRNFYRAVVKNVTLGTRVSVSNPIWLDKEPEVEAETTEE